MSKLDDKLFRLAFESAPFGMEILRLADPDDPTSLTPIAVNQAACDLLGQDLRDDIGRPWRDTSPELAGSDFPTMFAEALKNQRVATWELEYGDDRFAQNWWRGTVTPIGPDLLFMVFQNISADKRHELELARSNAELDQFAYVASHDLRAPLRDIGNLASWIDEDAGDTLPADSVGHLATLRQRIDRMRTLLDDLLEYARASQMFAAPEEFELRDLCEGVANVLPKRPGIEVTWPEVDLSFRAPRVPLETVLRNLISNAIKHHTGERGRIEVSVRVVGGDAIFEVSDDGPGIAPEHHERVFGMFQKLGAGDESTSSGMGLTLVRRLVAQYGGGLALESAEGRGSVFRFYWPIADDR